MVRRRDILPASPSDGPLRRAAASCSCWCRSLSCFYRNGGTDRIRFATYVLVLGYHHPLEIAKRYGTLDMISNGRLILGVGVGTLKEEFDLLGAPFQERGPRGDDALRALRASLSQPLPVPRRLACTTRPTSVRPVLAPIWVQPSTVRPSV